MNKIHIKLTRIDNYSKQITFKSQYKTPKQRYITPHGRCKCRQEINHLIFNHEYHKIPWVRETRIQFLFEIMFPTQDQARNSKSFQKMVINMLGNLTVKVIFKEMAFIHTFLKAINIGGNLEMISLMEEESYI